MNIQSRISAHRGLSRKELLDQADMHFTNYLTEISKYLIENATMDEQYTYYLSLLPAIMIAEDGHYYESEHAFWGTIFTPKLVSEIRKQAKRIIDKVEDISSVLYLQDLLRRLSCSAREDALDFCVCYLLYFSCVNEKNLRLLDDIFNRI